MLHIDNSTITANTGMAVAVDDSAYIILKDTTVTGNISSNVFRITSYSDYFK